MKTCNNHNLNKRLQICTSLKVDGNRDNSLSPDEKIFCLNISHCYKRANFDINILYMN